MSATNAISARLIGAIFLERGLVTDEQLQSALALQVETKEHLGEILVQHFGVSRIELASVLAEQWADLERASAGAVPSDVEKPALQVVPHTSEASLEPAGDTEELDDEARRPLGEIFVERGLVTDAELDRALEIQKEGDEKLGEILVAQGSITRLQLASALAEQWTALRKIRPPSSSDGVSAPTAGQVREVAPSADVDRLHEAVSALEQRLRAAESVAAREPWREEIASTAEGLQSTLAELETRLAEAATRADLAPVEELRTRVHELSNRIEENATSERLQDADLTRRVESAAEAAEAAKSSLGGAFESLSLRLADVESRVHDRSELTDLQRELDTLIERVGELGGEVRGSETDELRDEVKRLTDEVNRLGVSLGEADPALSARVDALAGRIDDIALTSEQVAASRDERAALESELGALTNRLDALEGSGSEIAEIRGSLAELHAQPAVDSVLAERLSHYGAAPDQLAELRERLDEVERQNTELTERNPALDERIESLTGRLQALESAGPADELVGLHRAVEELAARPTADPALAERVERIANRLDTAPSAEQVVELQAQVEELASRPAADPGLSERIERVANRIDTMPSAGQLDELRTRLDELSSNIEAPPQGLNELREQVESLATRPASDPALADRIDGLAHRLERTASAEQLNDLESRLDQLSARAGTPPEGLAELQAQVVELAARPAGDPALAERVERIANRLDEAPSGEGVDKLSDRLEELAGRVGKSGEGLAELRALVDGLASRPTGNPALAERVEKLGRRLDDLGEQASASETTSSGQIEELSRRLDDVSTALRKLRKNRERDDEMSSQPGMPPEELAELRQLVEEVAARPSGDPDLAKRVEQLAGELRELTAGKDQIDGLRDRVDELARADDERRAATDSEFDSLADDLRRTVERLGARVDAVEERGSDRSEIDYEPRLGALESKLEDAVTRDDAIGDRLEYVTGRISAVDELTGRLDDLTERLGAHESTQGKGVKKSDLSALRTELADRLEALDQRVESLAGASADAKDSLADRLDEAVASLRKDIDGRQVEVDERVAASERDAAALREQLGRLLETANANDSERNDAETDLGRRIEELDKQLAERLATPTADLAPVLDDVRAELDSLSERLDRSDVTTAEALEKLTTDLEAIAQSSIDLLGHVERAGTGDTSEFDARIEGLERRVEDDAARADEQVRATEEALREGLAALGGRLADTESSYIEAGSALRRSIERLGAAIVEADGVVAGRTPSDTIADEPHAGPFLAFVPNGAGYGLRELEGAVPAVGDPVSIPDGDDELVVTRVGRSPLPLDRRRCVYLERRSGMASSLDRVP